MRRISLFFLCIGVVTMSCEDAGSTEDGGSTLCNANETYHEASNTCKCDTSNHWEGEAGACTCAKGYIEFFGQCVTSAETTCDAVKEVYDSASNTCKCDTSIHWEGEAGACTCPNGYIESSGQCVTSAETTCDAVKEIYDSASNTCKCDTSKNWEGEAGSCTCRSGDVEISGQCVTSAEATCDAVKEVYDKDSNTCKCDTSKFFEGEAGACTCVKDHVQIGNTCEEKQTCRTDQVYVEDSNTCDCPEWFMEQDGKCKEYCLGDKEVRGEGGKCTCSDDYVRLESTCIPPSSCVRENATWNSTLNTHQCNEGTQLFLGCCQSLTVGETVFFGSYPQTADSTEKSPLKWQILEITDDAVLLLSKYALEQYPYHDKYEDITWEKSNVRSYLNALSGMHNKNNIDHTSDGFLKNAFTADEQKRIKQVMNKNPNSKWYGSALGGNDTEDKVFLLSHDEVLKYFPTNKSRIAHPTGYAIRPPEGSGRKNLYTCQVTCSGDNSCNTSSCNSSGSDVQVCSDVQVYSDVQCSSRWWLRSPGYYTNSYYTNMAAGVRVVGSVESYIVDGGNPGLRPALYVHMNL